MVQADWLVPKVGGHLALCCVYHVNQGELSHDHDYMIPHMSFPIGVLLEPSLYL